MQRLSYSHARNSTSDTAHRTSRNLENTQTTVHSARAHAAHSITRTLERTNARDRVLMRRVQLTVSTDASTGHGTEVSCDATARGASL